jgi:uncharacterized protein YbjT (DUF2867 family)
LKILLAGATGLVGGQLLNYLLADAAVTTVYTVARVPLPTHPKLTAFVGDIPRWPAQIADTRPDVVVSALGTTIKQAGSEQAFAAVDHDAVLAVAGSAAAAGARRMMLVSSVGAHAASRNFYLSTKGKTELALQAIGFERIDIFRPGLLRGKRTGPVRLGEAFGKAISPITDFLTPAVLDHYRSIDSAVVARAMHAAARLDTLGIYTHQFRDMRAMAGAN